MAVTQLSDAYVHDVYGTFTSINSPETTAFYQSGIIARSPVLDAIARDGGKNATVPFWNDLDPTIEPNYSNDDPADFAVPNAINSGTMTARKAWVNQSFGSMDLIVELAGSDPMQHIKNRFGTYWMRQLQRRMIAMAVGVVADNIANDAGDMGVDISGAAGDDANFGSNAFIDAAYTMGSEVGALTAIAMHSAVEARAVKNNEIVYIPDSEGNLTIKTYMGRRVIVDDNMPLSGGVYTSILFGGRSIGFGSEEGHTFALGEGAPRVASEIYRRPDAGNGGGMESLWERQTWLLHPFGFSFIEAGGGALTELSPTLAELRLAAKWNRIVTRKLVPMAWIKSKA